MSIDKQEIDAVIQDITASDLRPTHQKDIRRTLLLAKDAINGVSDKSQAISEAIAGLAICFANDAMFRREDFRELFSEMLNGHELKCSMADKVPRIVIETMQAEALKEDGSQLASVAGHGVKAKADPWTVRIVAIAAVACFAISAYIVKTISGG